MSEGGPKIVSLAAAQRQKEAGARAKFFGDNPYFINYDALRNPESVRRESVDALAVEVIRSLRGNPECTPENQVAAHEKLKEEVGGVEVLLENSDLNAWLQDPARYYAAADKYLEFVDGIAQKVLDKDLRESMRSRNPRLGEEAKPKEFTQAPTKVLLERLRRCDMSSEELWKHYVDTALEYRKRRREGAL